MATSVCSEDSVNRGLVPITDSDTGGIGVLLWADQGEDETLRFQIPSEFLPDVVQERLYDKVAFFVRTLSDLEEESLQQFVGMLFHDKGQPRSEGYAALSQLQDRLEKRLERKFQDLYVQVVKLRVNKAEGRGEYDFFALLDLSKLWSTVTDYLDGLERQIILCSVLKSFELRGKPLSRSDLMKEREEMPEFSPLAKDLAETGLKIYNSKPEGYYSSRRALLEDLLEATSTAGDVRTLQYQLGVLYPKGTPGAPTKERREALLKEMIRRFRAAVKNGKTGKNGKSK